MSALRVLLIGFGFTGGVGGAPGLSSCEVLFPNCVFDDVVLLFMLLLFGLLPPDTCRIGFRAGNGDENDLNLKLESKSLSVVGAAGSIGSDASAISRESFEE